ncbi:hypothetical protein EV213_12239 [Aureibacillus halotolerans]|uniref:Uncharacterized protein n=2 Tax=Aureibacillus halotolerans TaxID=1508390 RepID=A0A4R6TRF2_9BACI|nr:hypothetical protein EV213_12239 [Aureibacillus halotolerans]
MSEKSIGKVEIKDLVEINVAEIREGDCFVWEGEEVKGLTIGKRYEIFLHKGNFVHKRDDGTPLSAEIGFKDKRYYRRVKPVQPKEDDRLREDYEALKKTHLALQKAHDNRVERVEALERQNKAYQTLLLCEWEGSK